MASVWKAHPDRFLGVEKYRWAFLRPLTVFPNYFPDRLYVRKG